MWDVAGFALFDMSSVSNLELGESTWLDLVSDLQSRNRFGSNLRKLKEHNWPNLVSGLQGRDRLGSRIENLDGLGSSE